MVAVVGALITTRFLIPVTIFPFIQRITKKKHYLFNKCWIVCRSTSISEYTDVPAICTQLHHYQLCWISICNKGRGYQYEIESFMDGRAFSLREKAKSKVFAPWSVLRMTDLFTPPPV